MITYNNCNVSVYTNDGNVVIINDELANFDTLPSVASNFYYLLWWNNTELPRYSLFVKDENNEIKEIVLECTEENFNIHVAPFVKIWEENYSEENKLKEYKEEKKYELNDIFENILNNSYLTSSLGYKINANHTSKSNIEGLITYLSKETSITSTRFRIYDNTFVQVTIDDLNILLLEVIKSINSLYDQKWIYDEKIKNGTTTKEIESLEFIFTYSDFTK